MMYKTNKVCMLYVMILLFIFSLQGGTLWAQVSSRDVMRVCLVEGDTINFPVENIKEVVFEKESLTEVVDTAFVEWVDLGLSVKWAKWNLGAKTYKESGNLYSWGEWKPKKKYIPASYQAPRLVYNYDFELAGTPFDPATRMFPQGGRMPSYQEYEELIGYCDITRVTIDGQTYFKLTGPSGNSIFFKFEETCWLSDRLGGITSDGKTYAHKMSLSTSEYNDWIKLGFLDETWKGYYIRPVCQIELKEDPKLELTHFFDDGSNQKDHFKLKIAEEVKSKYNINSKDVGFFYSQTPNILNQHELYYCPFRNYVNFDVWETDNQFQDGTVYYAIPYVVIGGVCHLGEEISFTAGSDLPVYAVGDLYPNSVSPEGVVCDISNEGRHGKIISLDQGRGMWDTYSFITENEGAFSETDGEINTKKINGTHFPAANWCTAKGAEWYLPARYELTSFCTSVGVINQALRSVGGVEIEGFYWSSTEYGKYQDLAYIVCLAESSSMGYETGWSSYNSKSQSRGIRAMKKF